MLSRCDKRGRNYDRCLQPNAVLDKLSLALSNQLVTEGEIRALKTLFYSEYDSNQNKANRSGSVLRAKVWWSVSLA